MSSLREEPFYNLKAVVQQTGLKPDTLRAWERRYGLPAPERSAGGHRLYSQRDISIIKWLMARQREGMSIKRAVQLWEQLVAEGRDPLRTPAPLAGPSAPTTPATRVAEGTIAELREEWIEACLAYDEPRAEQILTQAFALYPPETVCLDLLQKALAEIGEGWYAGEVTVQQEHFASALALRRLEALVMAAPPPARPGRILAACPPEENHVFGLLLLTFLLRRRGWTVVYLGANVPTEQLETTVQATEPQLVILAAQQLHSAATLLDAARLLEALDIPLAYGGLIFNLIPELRARIPGHFLGERLEAAPQVAESLLTAPRPAPDTEAVPAQYQQARRHFLQQMGQIETELSQDLSRVEIEPDHLALANQELALNIDAALALGDMDYLGTDIDWIEGLVKNHQLPPGSLYGYLHAYRQAAQEHLDEPGEPIVRWLDALLEGSDPA